MHFIIRVFMYRQTLPQMLIVATTQENFLLHILANFNHVFNTPKSIFVSAAKFSLGQDIPAILYALFLNMSVLGFYETYNEIFTSPFSGPTFDP